MPNHVRNKVTIHGKPEVLAQVCNFVAGETPFDFEKILPMPEPFHNLHSGMTTIDGKRYESWREVDGKSVGIEPEEIAQWRRDYGAAGWSDWSIANWGTKWNAYSVSDPSTTDRTLRYSFDTAWNTPEPVLQALSNRFGVKITVAVSGEVDRRYSYTIKPEADR